MYTYQHIAHRYDHKPALDPGRLRHPCWLIVDGERINFVHKGAFGEKHWQCSLIHPWARLARAADGSLQLWKARFSWLGVAGYPRLLEFEQAPGEARPSAERRLLIAYHNNRPWALAVRRHDVEADPGFRGWVMSLPRSTDVGLSNL